MGIDGGKGAEWKRLYPFGSHFVKIRGFDYHYVDEGTGPPVVMVHGNPTWSFYYRRLILGLRDDYRTVVPDHLGCGLSDRPAEGQYSFRFADRVADLGVLMDHLGLDDVTLVGHDWGGAIGLAWAAEHPGRVRRIVMMNTSAFRLPPGKKIPWQLELVRNVPLISRPAVLLFNLFARGAIWTASHQRLSPAVRAGLLAPYRTYRGRLASLKFVQDIPLRPGDPSWPTLTRLEDHLYRLADKPWLVLWGLEDFVFDRDFLEEFQRRLPEAEYRVWTDAGHWVLEDKPGEVLAAVRDFLSRTRP